MITQQSPPVRKGFKWIYRHGCTCQKCLWGTNCEGRTWTHWIEVRDNHSDQTTE